MLGKRVNGNSPPLTKYFKTIPSPSVKSEDKENIMPLKKVKRERDCNGSSRRAHKPSVMPIFLTGNHESIRRRPLGSAGSSMSSPTDIIVISSDEEISPSKKRKLSVSPTSPVEVDAYDESKHSLTIKELFDDSVKNKPQFPPVDQSRLPNFLKSPTPESSDSDHELPSLIHKSKPSPRRLQDAEGILPSLNGRPCSKHMNNHRNSTCDSEPLPYPSINPTIPNDVFEEKTPIASPLESIEEPDLSSSDLTEPEHSITYILNQLIEIESEEEVAQLVSRSCGVAEDCLMDGLVRLFTDSQEERVEHYLSLCMASPSMQLSSTVNYLDMVASPYLMPSSTCLIGVWRALLKDKVNPSAAESCVRYLSSLLLTHPPNQSDNVRGQYNQLIREVRDDLMDLLESSIPWKVNLLAFVLRIMLLDYNHLVKTSEISRRIPLFQQIFWSHSSPRLINQTVRRFLRTITDILETDVSVIMARRLEVSCQLLFLVQTCCDVSQEIVFYLQPKKSLTPSKVNLFLSLLHPLRLVSTVYEELECFTNHV